MDTEVRINHADVAGGIKSEDITERSLAVMDGKHLTTYLRQAQVLSNAKYITLGNCLGNYISFCNALYV